MSSGRQEQLEQLFLTATKMATPTERAAFLEEACSGDGSLRAAVEELLEADAQTNTFLDQPPVDSGTIPQASWAAEEPGTKIGRYRILQLIGEGGFGSVYLAEQEEPVRREVAIKVIKLGMDTRQVIARFEAERQALALMDHPNIAKVLDAGATEGGRPYFVMELVRGITITEYCAANSLSVHQRLELFLPICHAVQHAHQKGIIHRDLKPNNVLVTSHDGWAVPKVIDFGIAKVTSQRPGRRTRLTEFGQFIGTPEYMSPEEIAGVDVDTRADVYSLGALLYELLTTSTPLKAATLRKLSIDEVKRLIREVDPERPSARVATLAAVDTDTPTPYLASPVALARLIRGDLDWIVMKALEKERTQRYQTANELGADLERHLNNEPVLAGPPKVTYRLQKFVRRNRVAVTAGLLAAAALLIGFTLATIGLVQANKAKADLELKHDMAESAKLLAEQARADEQAQRELAETNERVALREAAKYSAVNDFLQDMLASVDPRAAPGREITVREIIDEAAARLEADALTKQPEVEAAVRMTLGKAYEAIGIYRAAEAHLRAALELRQQVLGEEHPETLQVQSVLGSVLCRRGQYAQAEALLRRTVATQRRVLGPEHPDTLSSMNGLGISLWRQDGNIEGETVHREALEIQQRILGENHLEVLRSRANLATALLRQRRYAEAEPLFRQVLEIERRMLGDEHPDTQVAVNNLAVTLEQQGEYEEAEALYREAFETDCRILGPAHPGTRIPLENLLDVLRAQGRFEDAGLVVAQRIAHLKRAAEQPGVKARTLNEYAWVLLTCEPESLRDPEAALPIAKRAVQLDGGRDADILDTLALARWRTGDLEGAIQTQRKAIAQARSEARDNRASMEARLVEMLAEAGSPIAGARVGFERWTASAADALRTIIMPGGEAYAHGLVLLAQGQAAEAESALRQCLAAREDSLPAHHWAVADAASLVGVALVRQGRFAEAESLLLEAFDTVQENRKVSERHVDRVVGRVVALYEAWGREDRAAAWRDVIGRE